MKPLRPRGKSSPKLRSAKSASSRSFAAAPRGELLKSTRRSKPLLPPAEIAAAESSSLAALMASKTRWIRRCVDGGALPQLTPEGLGLLKSWILLHPEIADESVLELEKISQDLGQVIDWVLGRLHPSEKLKALWTARRKRNADEAAILEEEAEFLLTQVELELPEWVTFWQERHAQVVFH